MKKFIKSKVTIAVLGVSFLFAGANAYATTALDTNIVQIIKTGVQAIGPAMATNANREIQNAANGLETDLTNYLSEKTNTVITELETAKENEITRAQQELENHYNQLVTEADTVFEQEVNDVKNNIHNSTSAKIDSAKNELTQKFEQELQKKLSEITSSNN